MRKRIDLLSTTGIEKTCFVIKQAFSAEFCQHLLADKVDDFRIASTHYPTSYRNNCRQVFEDPKLSQRLFDEVQTHIPKSYEAKGSNSLDARETGSWKLKKINDRLRMCRYACNQYFNKHLDGIHYESETVQSKLTFLVYLNGHETFEGGRTLFFQSKEDNEPVQSFSPSQGDLIIFDHNIWHSGERLNAGVKYILRSDIMYEKKAANSGHHFTRKPFQEGHLGYIWSIARWGNYFVTGGRDKMLKCWNSDGSILDFAKSHENSVLDILVMNDKLIVTSSRDRSIKIWTLKNKNGQSKTLHDNPADHLKLSVLCKVKKHSAAVLCLCKLTSSCFASSGGDGKVNIIDIGNPTTPLSTWAAHDEWVWAMESPAYGYLITASEDGLLKVWDYKMGTCVHECDHSHGIPINSMTFDKNDGVLYVGKSNGDLECLKWKRDSKKLSLLGTFHAHTASIRCLKLHSQYLISGSEDNTVKVWELSNINFDSSNVSILPITSFEHNNFVQGIEVADSKVISVSYDGTISQHEILPSNIMNE